MNSTLPLPTILAISGSLRKGSSCDAVLAVAADIFRGKANFIFYEGLGTLPQFDDNKQPDDAVLVFREQLQTSDGVLICSPEYAFGVPGSLKNAIDWTVSSGEFVNKPLALITAATVGVNAHAAWQLIFTAVSARLEEESKLLLPYIRSKMNDRGVICDSETLIAIEKVCTSLLKTINERE